MTKKDCDNYLDGLCIKDVDSGRVWSCTCFIKKIRAHQSWLISRTRFPNLITCPYPKLRKD